MDNRQIKARKKARKHVMQALYQWYMTNNELTDIEAQVRTQFDMSKIDESFFCELLYGIPREIDTIDKTIQEESNHAIDELTPVELAILRLCCYELLYRLDVPYKVILKESISLAREFGTEDGHRYVNGVLDKIAKKVRLHEINHLSS